jgi:hypothetical protein
MSCITSQGRGIKGMAYPDGTIVSALVMVSGIFQKAQNPKPESSCSSLELKLARRRLGSIEVLQQKGWRKTRGYPCPIGAVLIMDLMRGGKCT